MDLQAMRDKFRTLVGDDAGEYSDPEIDDVLNRVHRWGVPDLVDAITSAGEASIPIVAGDDEYEFDDSLVLAPDPNHFFLDDRPLRCVQDYSQFWTEYKRSNTSQSTPQLALLNGLKVTLRPVPSANATLYCKAEVYADALTVAGINYEPRALLDVYLAVIETTGDVGDDTIVQKAVQLAQTVLNQVRKRSLSVPATPKRSGDL